MSILPVAVATMLRDAPSEKGQEATLGNRFLQHVWPPKASHERINWEELRAVERPLSMWGYSGRGKLVLFRADSDAGVDRNGLTGARY